MSNRSKEGAIPSLKLHFGTSQVRDCPCSPSHVAKERLAILRPQNLDDHREYSGARFGMVSWDWLNIKQTSLGNIPVILNGTKEPTGDVVLKSSIALRMRQQRWHGIVKEGDNPVYYSWFQVSCIVTSSTTCSFAQLQNGSQHGLCKQQKGKVHLEWKHQAALYQHPRVFPQSQVCVARWGCNREGYDTVWRPRQC